MVSPPGLVRKARTFSISWEVEGVGTILGTFTGKLAILFVHSMRQKRRVRKVGKFATACRQDIGCFFSWTGVASWLLLSVEKDSIIFGANYAGQPTVPAQTNQVQPSSSHSKTGIICSILLNILEGHRQSRCGVQVAFHRNTLLNTWVCNLAQNACPSGAYYSTNGGKLGSCLRPDTSY